jgi:Na+/H+ antiporter NhaD/arsenite permease-like protein
MDTSVLLYPLIITVFGLGYAAIIFEYTLKVNKTAVALLIAALCWAIYFLCSTAPVNSDLQKLGEHVNDVSQIIFFLMGAMTLVELIDSHKGFKIVTDLIRTTSKRKMLWIVAIISFCLSGVLDNLTTTILMVSLLRKMIPARKERFLLSCIVIVAANAGGAWTPIGDVTTTMLWINGQLSSLNVMRALILPSLVAMLVPMCYFSFREKGVYADFGE